MAKVLPLSRVARAVLIQTLLDQRHDSTAALSQLLLQHLVDQLGPVTGDLLCSIVQDFPTRVTNDIVLALAPPHLKGINLQKCFNVTASGIQKLLERCPKLQGINLTECNQLMTEPFFHLVANQGTLLTDVTVDNTSISDDMVKALLRTQKLLTQLSLSNCSDITNNVFLLDDSQCLRGNLVELEEYQCCLSTVNLSSNKQLTSIVVYHLVTLCGPNLQYLNCSYTSVDCIVLFYLSGFGMEDTLHLLNEESVEKSAGEQQERGLCSSDSVEVTDAENIQGNEELSSEKPCSNFNDTVATNKAVVKILTGEHNSEETVKEDSNVKITSASIVMPNKHMDQDKSSQYGDGAKICDKVYSLPKGVSKSVLITNVPVSSTLPKPVEEAKLRRTSSTKDATQMLSDALDMLDNNVHQVIPSSRSRDCPSYQDFAANLGSGSANELSFSAAEDTPEEVFVANRERARDHRRHSAGGRLLYIPVLEPLRDMGDELSAHSLPDLDTSTADNDASLSDGNVSGGDQMTASAELAEAADFGPDANLSNSSPQLEATGIDGDIFLFPSSSSSVVIDALQSTPVMEASATDDSILGETFLGCCDAPFMDEDEMNEMLQHEENVASVVGGSSKVTDHNQNIFKKTVIQQVSCNIPEEKNCSPSDVRITNPKDAPQTITEPNLPLSGQEEIGTKSKTCDLQGLDVEYKNSGIIGATLDHSAGAIPKLGSQRDNVQRETENETTKCQKIFTPNVLSLDMSGIDLQTDEDTTKCAFRSFFSANRNIEKVAFTWKSLTDDAVMEIAHHAKNLKHLFLVNCEHLSSSSLAEIGLKCLHLQELILYGVCFISDAALMPALVNHKLLRLSLAETEVTDLTLKMIAANSPKITSLNLSWCEEITNEGVKQLALHCTSLRHLKLRQVSVSEQVLMELVQNCTELQELDVSTVNNISDSTLQLMAENLQDLQKLDISWNTALTDAGVSALMLTCTDLKELILAGIKRLTSKPFLPIIAELSKWRRCQALLKLKYQEQQKLGKTEDGHGSSDEEFEDLYLAHRSTSYAPSLHYLDLEYCDQLNDHHLAEIVAICRGTLQVRDYYGQMVEPRFFASIQGHIFVAQQQE